MVSLATMRWLSGLLGSRRGLRRGKQHQQVKRGLRYDVFSQTEEICITLVGKSKTVANYISLRIQKCVPNLDFLYSLF